MTRPNLSVFIIDMSKIVIKARDEGISDEMILISNKKNLNYL